MICGVCAKNTVVWLVQVNDRNCPDSVRGTWLERCASCAAQVRKYWRSVKQRTLAEGPA